MNILLFPPIAFILIFVFVYILFKIITPAPKNPASIQEEEGKVRDLESNRDILDYQKFLPYAAFFTVLHVAGLMMATWAFNPLAETIGPVIAYLISIIIILIALFI